MAFVPGGHILAAVLAAIHSLMPSRLALLMHMLGLLHRGLGCRHRCRLGSGRSCRDHQRHHGQVSRFRKLQFEGSGALGGRCGRFRVKAEQRRHWDGRSNLASHANTFDGQRVTRRQGPGASHRAGGDSSFQGAVGILIRAMPRGHVHRHVIAGARRRGRHAEWHEQHRNKQEKARQHASILGLRLVDHNGFKRRSRVR